MTLARYTAITGIAITSTNTATITAQLARTQVILEGLLGYTLDATATNDNQYVELSKTDDDCSCGEYTTDGLLAPDAIVGSYRLFPYNPHDKNLLIDPASEIHAVKLVNRDVTLKTLDVEEYRPHYQNGVIKSLENCDRWCLCQNDCNCTQVAVDADWLWGVGDTLPLDLETLWADLVTHYSDDDNKIASETLGTHSYTRFKQTSPDTMEYGQTVIMKYAGPNGSAIKTVTV